MSIMVLTPVLSIRKKKYFLYQYCPGFLSYTTCPRSTNFRSIPPGRPIISGINSLTSRAGKYIDGFLQPLVKSLPAYIKDSRHTINLLKNCAYKEGYWLVTADVTSLYTIIPHDWGTSSVNYFLNKDTTLPNRQKGFIMELLEYATTHHFFGIVIISKRRVWLWGQNSPPV